MHTYAEHGRYNVVPAVTDDHAATDAKTHRYSPKARPHGWSKCLAGATGWAGSALARGIAQVDDIELVAAVSRSHAGHNLGEVLGEPTLAARSTRPPRRRSPPV